MRYGPTKWLRPYATPGMNGLKLLTFFLDKNLYSKHGLLHFS